MPSTRGKIGAIEWLGLCIFAVVYLAVLVIFAARTRLPAPFSDEYDWIARTFQPISLGYFWEAHNNQRIVWARLFTLIDVRLFRGANLSAFTASLSVMIAAGVLAARMFLLSEPSPRTAVAGAILVFVAMTEATLVSDAAWPVNSVYVYVAAFATLSIVAFEAANDSRGSRGLVLCAWIAGVLSGFGNAAGLAVWPVLLLSAVRYRRSDRATLAVLGGGFVFAAATLAGLGSPAGSPTTTPTHGSAHLFKAAAYFLDYLGLPFTGNRAPHLANFIFGAAVGGAAFALLARPTASKLGRIGQTLILFSGATALLAALGRSDELPVPVAPLRYGVLLAPLHAGLVFRLAPVLTAISRRVSPRLFWAGLGGVLATALAWEVFAGLWALSYAQTIRRANSAFARGDHRPEVLTWVYPDAARAEALRSEMRSRGLFPNGWVP